MKQYLSLLIVLLAVGIIRANSIEAGQRTGYTIDHAAGRIHDSTESRHYARLEQETEIHKSAKDVQLMRIEVNTNYPEIMQGHLRLGTGAGPDGPTYGVNSLYLTRDNKPWLPVMGEIHFARYPNESWEEAVLAMKAGGIDIIATYVFWIFHEEFQGRYEWTGDRNLREFVQLCHKHEMPVWLRIGPWCHGEARNGGFPDWLKDVCQPRTLDPAYFDQVRRWYSAVSEQVQGLYHKDGGPIIGIQFDNEFGHGEGGDEYILQCKRIARELDMDVPYYSVTGWGWAWVPKDEVLPAQACYVDPMWMPGCHQLPPPKELVFSYLTSLIVDTEVGVDSVAERARDDGMRYDPFRYPYAMCELGGGMPPSYSRRPIIYPEDTECMALCRLGEGANVIGYYMYHGGSQVLGETGRLCESGMPVVSYDFQAPLGEFGKTHPRYFRLKRLHQFIHDFGTELAQMRAALPETVPAADDPAELRYALRSNGTSGFLFFNNHQRYLDMPARNNIQFAVTMDQKEIVFPDTPITIPSGSMGIFPVNMPVADATLVYSTAQPLMKWSSDGITRLVLVGLTGIDVQLCFTGLKQAVVDGTEIEPDGHRFLVAPEHYSKVTLTTLMGSEIDVLVISDQDSLNAWNVGIGEARFLALSPIQLWQNGRELVFTARDLSSTILRVFPPADTSMVLEPDGTPLVPERRGRFSTYDLPALPDLPVDVKARAEVEVPEAHREYPFQEADVAAKAWRIHVGPVDWQQVDDVTVRFSYIGDTACLYLNGQLVADNFWSQPDWEIGLRRWRNELAGPETELVLVISPWIRGQQVFVQQPPEVTDQATARLLNVQAVAERKIVLRLAD